ncbi:beta-fructofuranosidase, insoluble isoenzyme CWINV3-like [Nicotiana sylvestris]|uniref:Beta-fructofuranosidase, insoluble isoenzyme CWINV3-like n=1 Tax=Nicotiana sylvestris TaxID=4096 RepID=A0A1U7VUM8_NICSY|nr:PREDICTED: beta-fructofuranosidase, insoluble isoenzyme CWINV3-like [Nicotiana sylvestris]
MAQPYRTAYHFQPPRNWINDPNGPMIYKGIYHLFYQYNPEAAIWGNLAWGHSTSTDLVDWTIHPPALIPSDSYDINGCWSGSVTLLQNGTPAILYTGCDTQDTQLQNLAIPKDLSDPYLIEWIKSDHNPIMVPNPGEETLFRDPSTAWLGPDDGIWRVIIGNEREGNGTAILYKSKDFIHWTEAERPLHWTNETRMWECPEIFPVLVDGTENGVDTKVIFQGIKYVLKISVAGTGVDYYTIGNYDHENDVYIPDDGFVDNIESGLRVDYGRFYASKSFFDSAKTRRILIAWVDESTSREIDIIKGWSGLQTFPRKIWLDKAGKQLVQWPVEELETLRKNQVILPATTLKAGSKSEIPGVTGAQADVEISFSIPIATLEQAEVLESSWSNSQEICRQKASSANSTGVGPFGLLVLASNTIEEYTAVFFRIFKKNGKFVVLMGCDQKRSAEGFEYDTSKYGAFLDVDPVTEKLSLRTLIDHSIVESFGGGGKTCITTRAYPTLAINDNAHIFVFNNGSHDVEVSGLSAWSLNRAQIN